MFVCHLLSQQLPSRRSTFNLQYLLQHSNVYLCFWMAESLFTDKISKKIHILLPLAEQSNASLEGGLSCKKVIAF